VLYIVPIYVAGITQGSMWRAIDEGGKLAYPDFLETLSAVIPMYVVRVIGGTLYLVGATLAFVNLLATWMRRPARYEVVVHQMAPLQAGFQDPPLPQSRLKGMAVVDLAHKIDVWQQAAWHRRLERLPLRFTIYVAIAVVVASMFEIIPTFLIRSNVPTIQSVKPYTPLEVAGRDIYIGEGCYNCHSQMIRPILAETKRYGEFSKPGEFVYDHPFQWGSRRIGPDLAREGGRQSSVWQVLHLQNPRQINERSIMPAYPWMLTKDIDFGGIPPRLRALSKVGVPYDQATISDGEGLARKQAAEVAKEIVAQNGPGGLDTKQVVALVAYLQRLGKDLYATPAVAAAASAPTAAPTGDNP
jgi:cytochrome c oxidase cbb3-type subunit I/II